MRKRLPGSWILTTLVFAGCGSGGGVEGPVSPPPPPVVILDFGPISGDWAGWLVEPSGVSFWTRASLEPQAQAGAAVGTVEYGIGDPDDPPDCGGTWIASKAEPPVFELLERITFGAGCPDGTVRLELESGSLAYDFSPVSGAAFAEGTLTRGTDPGTPP